MMATPRVAAAICHLETPDAPELWTSNRRPPRVVSAQLELMCRRCPVRRPCAAVAVISEAQTGMYAGVFVPEKKVNNGWSDALEALRLIAGLPGPVEAGAGAVGVSA